MKLIIRRQFGSLRWEVVRRYAHREVLLAIRNTKAEAEGFAAIYRRKVEGARVWI